MKKMSIFNSIKVAPPFAETLGIFCLSLQVYTYKHGNNRYLDDIQVLAVVQLALSDFELTMTNMMKIYQDGILNLEDL